MFFRGLYTGPKSINKRRQFMWMTGFLTELKAMIPNALSLDRMVMVALLGVPSFTPLEEL